MFKIKKLIFLLISVIVCFNVQAQEQGGISHSEREPADTLDARATGQVRDAATGDLVIGARLTYMDVSAAISDSAGNFTIEVPDYNTTLRIEADGYQPKEVALKGRKKVTISLYKGEMHDFYNAVTLPMGPVIQSHTPFAVSAVNTGGNWSDVSETPDDYLQGKVAGLDVIRRSGTPGTGANMYLHGFTSLYGTNQPLVIVDGVLYDINEYGHSLISGYDQNPLAFIDIRDIDNITVLKNGSALYGTRGANGVILITTSRAKQEATRIDAAIYGGVNLAPADIPVMNASDYRVYLSEMLQSKGVTAKEMSLLPYMNNDKNSPDYYRYHDKNNWQRQVLGNSSVKNGYLKITGGDNIAMYALTMGFLKSEGILKNTDRTRYNTRFNADLNLSKRLKAATNLSFTYSENNLRNQGLDHTTNPIYTALVKAPFLPVHEVGDNGSVSPDLADSDTFNISNPVALIQDVRAFNRSYRFVGSVNLDYQLTDHLSVMTDIAITMDKIRESFFIPQSGVVSDTLNNAIAKNRSGAQVLRMFSFYNDTRLKYKRTFSQVHHLDLNLGVHYLHRTTEQDKGLGYNSATDELTGVGYGLNSLRQIGGNLGEYKWMNTYLNADYNLRDKYFLSFNMSMNGSSRSGDHAENGPVMRIGGYNYALMPSLSGAWLVSSENFLRPAHWLSLLKLRASVGRSGNDDIGNFAAQKYYVSQSLLGIEGLVRGNVQNDNLQWESVTHLNAGVDIALMDDRLNMSFDVYKKTTNNMITYEPAPVASGMDYTVTNSGGMRTTGWEANVNMRLINQEDFQWDAGFNIAHYHTVITKLPVDRILTQFAGATIVTRVGGAPNLFYGYQAKGVYASETEAANTGLSNKNADGSYTSFSGGDIHFADHNGDNIIDEKDQKVIGDPNPDFFGAVTTRLKWRKWSLNALFTYVQGNDIYNYARRQLESVSGYENQSQAVRSRWVTEGQATSIPRASWNDPMGNSRFSDRWIEDGSYFRLRSLSLSYTLPFTSGALKYIAVYATGNNLFTVTKYLGYDPEFDPVSGLFGQGVDIITEPQYRTVQLGIRLGL